METWRILLFVLTLLVAAPLLWAVVRANRNHAARRAKMTDAEREADDQKAAAWMQVW